MQHSLRRLRARARSLGLLWPLAALVAASCGSSAQTADPVSSGGSAASTGSGAAAVGSAAGSGNAAPSGKPVAGSGSTPTAGAAAMAGGAGSTAAQSSSAAAGTAGAAQSGSAAAGTAGAAQSSSAAGAAGAAQSGSAGAASSGPASFTRVWTEVLFPKGCAGAYCHGAGQGSLKFTTKEEAYKALVGVKAAGMACGASGKERVKAGDPAASLLVEKLEQTKPSCGDPMPIGTKLEPNCVSMSQPVCNTQAELSLIKQWIAAGARED